MLISFRAKRVNKKNVSPGKQSWGLGRRVGPRRGHRVPKCDVIKNEICEIMGFVKLF